MADAVSMAKALMLNGSTLRGQTIIVQAWDWDKVGRNNSLGRGALPLSSLQNALRFGDRVECAVSLSDKQAVPGQVLLALQWLPDRPAQLFLRMQWEADHMPPAEGTRAQGSSLTPD